MKRLKFWVWGVSFGLLTASIAVAATGGASTDTPSATFSAEDTRVLTRRCEGSDGTYAITRGVYVGTMTSSDSRLNGRLKMSVHSVYNTDEKAGWMRGTIHLRNAEKGTKASARLTAVNHDGMIEGLLTGQGGAPRAHLLANFSATFGADGFADGKLGTGGSGNQSLFYRSGCRRPDEETSASADERKRERGEKPSRPARTP